MLERNVYSAVIGWCCINVDWTLLDDGAVEFYIADFLSSYFIS